MGLFTNRKREEGEADFVGLTEASSTLAQFGIAPVDDAVDAPLLDPAPDVDLTLKRRLEDRPRVQAGNVEIDAAGLLNMLGVDHNATLIDISDARQRFLAEHLPADSDDVDAAELKEKIRREVNTAYASFRLTHAG